MDTQQFPSLKLRIATGFSLFFLSPFIGEFLLGNMPITMLWLLPVLALLYGTGSLLIRETAVRLKLKWGGILILCFVYGIIEEAFFTQSLFDPNYLGLRLLDYGYIKSLGIGAWWTIYVLGIHTVWSTAVPIAMIDSLFPKTKNTPLLGKWVYIIMIVLFVTACIGPVLSRGENEFMASTMQFIITLIMVLLLILSVFLLGRTTKDKVINGRKVPGVIIIGIIASLLSSGFMAMTNLIKLIPAELNVGGMLLFFVTGCLLFKIWSKRSDWNATHSLSLIGGLLFTYIWYGFVQVPSIGKITPLFDAIGNIIFSCIAVWLYYLAWKNVSKAFVSGGITESSH
jgi:hypothetical protein